MSAAYLELVEMGICTHRLCLPQVIKTLACVENPLCARRCAAELCKDPKKLGRVLLAANNEIFIPSLTMSSKKDGDFWMTKQNNDYEQP